MALQRQNFTLQMGQGVDTKTDPKQVIAGKLIELENATFQSTNRLTKRPGNVELAASSGLISGNAIAPFQDQLTIMDGSSIYSYGEQFDNLVNKGTKIAVDMTVDSVIKNSYQQTAPDSAILNGLSCFAWQDSQGGVHYSVFDVATKQLILSNVALGSTTYNPKVVNVGSLFCILYVDGTTLKALAINSLNPTSAPTTATIVSLGSNTTYDAVEAQDGTGAYTAVYVAYSNASNNLAWTKFNSSFVVTTPLTYAETPVRMAIVVNNPSPTAVRIAYSTTTAIKVIHSDAALSTQTGPYTIETVAGVTNIAAIFTASNTVKYFYEIMAPAIDNTFPDNYVRVNTVVGTTPGTSADFNRSVCLWSKPFIYGGDVYICLVHDSKLQATYFVFNSSGRVVSKIAPDNGGGQSYTGQLREVNQLSANSFQFTYLIKDLVESLNGDVYTQTGVNSANLVFQTALITETLGNNLNITGGVVSAYDGQNIAEQNFHLYPENMTITGSVTGGGLGQGQYQYAATYEWTDAQGQLHISNTSIPVTLNTDVQNSYLYPSSITDVSSIAIGGAVTNYGTLSYLTTAGTPSFPNDVQIGASITSSGIPASSYIQDYWIKTSIASPFALLNTTIGSTYTNPTVIETGAFNFPGKSVPNSAVIELYQNHSASYIGKITAGSAVISMNTTVGLKKGMTIVWAGTQFGLPFPTVTITAVTTTSITISVTPTVSVASQNIIVQTQYNGVFQGTSNFVDVNIGTGENPFFVGQNILYPIYASRGFNVGASVIEIKITNVVLLSGTTWRLTTSYTNSGATTAPIAMVFGMTQKHLLSVNQSVSASAGFVGALKIVSIGDYTVTVDQKSSTIATDLVLLSNLGSAAQVVVPTLRITDKPTSSPVSIAVYRTLVDENLFYRLTSFTAPILNDKTVDYISFTDNMTDNVLIGNEQLYTTGGVLPNSAPPALHVMTQYKNRLVGISSEDPLTWWFSKPVGTGIPVQFSQAFYKKIPELGGAVTALGRLDDKLVFFKRSSVFIIVGAGPNNLGLQDDFNDPELVTTDTGCTEPKSVVRMPMGLMYKSAKGIYLINRGLNVQYIGAPVEAYNGDAITSSQLIENVNQVRFTLATGKTLVYDYFFDQWSVFTNQNAIDSTLFETKTTYLTPGGRIFKEAENVWTDAGTPIYLRLKTAWLSMNGLQGLERIYNAMVLGDYKSPHTLTIQVAHEFDATPSQTTAIPSPTSPGVYQYKVYMTRQKTDAMQFTLQESQTGPTYGEGLDISAITIEAGVKSGTNKLPASKLYG